MPNSTQGNLDRSGLLAAWMEGALNAEQRDQFESLCSTDSEFAQQVQIANQVTMQSQDYRTASVPNWDAAGTFDTPAERKWWQWQGLPVFSTAMSILAVVMVVSGFELHIKDNSMTISFNKGTPDIEQLVEQKMTQFRGDQQQQLSAFTQSLQEQQLATSTQLTNYLLASSRQERKEDFGELIKFINEQRSDDQIYFARQLNQLQQEIYDTPGTSTWGDNNLADDLDE